MARTRSAGLHRAEPTAPRAPACPLMSIRSRFPESSSRQPTVVLEPCPDPVRSDPTRSDPIRQTAPARRALLAHTIGGHEAVRTRATASHAPEPRPRTSQGQGQGQGHEVVRTGAGPRTRRTGNGAPCGPGRHPGRADGPAARHKRPPLSRRHAAPASVRVHGPFGRPTAVARPVAGPQSRGAGPGRRRGPARTRNRPRTGGEPCPPTPPCPYEPRNRSRPTARGRPAGAIASAARCAGRPPRSFCTPPCG